MIFKVQLSACLRGHLSHVDTTFHPTEDPLFSIASSMWLGRISLLLAALPRWTHRQLSTEIGVRVLEWGGRHCLLFFPLSLSFKDVRIYFFLFCIDMPSTQVRILEGRVNEASQHFSHKSQTDRALICYGKLHLKLVPGSARAVF